MSSTPTLATTDAALVKFADLVGEVGPVAVAGAKTRWERGGALDANTRIIAAPSGIVDYVPEEMIVTVRAGTTVAELHAALAEKGQRSALPERGGTVGGALAVGENDWRVLGVGTVRSALLQVRFVSATGEIITGGGPTVKNVTGFDLPRLLVGSLGTLGLIGEVILRTNPIPAVSQWYQAPSDETGVSPFEAHRVVLAPSAVTWDGTTTRVLLEGHAVDVADQAARLAAVGPFTACDPPTPPNGHRWSLTPADLQRITAHDTGTFVALVGVGTVLAERQQPSRTLTPAVAAVHERMKAQFDPTGRFNPGRHPGIAS